jgi:hypothetical protein
VIKIAQCCKGLRQKIKWSFKQADVGSSSHSFGGPSSVKRIRHDTHDKFFFYFLFSANVSYSSTT